MTQAVQPLAETLTIKSYEEYKVLRYSDEQIAKAFGISMAELEHSKSLFGMANPLLNVVVEQSQVANEELQDQVNAMSASLRNLEWENEKLLEDLKKQRYIGIKQKEVIRLEREEKKRVFEDNESLKQKLAHSESEIKHLTDAVLSMSELIVLCKKQ